MQCPKCEVTMHVDDSGISSCVSCGHRVDMNSEEYRHSTLEGSTTYSNKSLMDREDGKISVKRYGTYNINGKEVNHVELLELAELGREYLKEYTNDAGEKLQSTEETLKERGNRYGEFKNHAYLSQAMKTLFDDHIKEYGMPEDFTAPMSEAIDMIFHKLARIANGDPQYVDNFVDIAGYAELVVKELSHEG